MSAVVISGNTSGTVTLDAPAVAGSTTITLPATSGTMALTSQTAGRLLRAPQILTSGTSYTTPAGCTAIYVELLGGGGGGGGTGAGTNFTGGAGSAGAYTTKYFTVTASTAYTYAIGAAGSAGASGANAGGNGGNTTFTVGATTVTATGGNGGIAGANNNEKIAAGVTATNGDFNASSVYGYTTGPTSFGGSTPYGAGGIVIVRPNSGANATGYGAGGSGAITSSTALAGGAGSQGFIRIWEYA